MNTTGQKFIRKLNGFFKTDIAYLIHGVGWLGGAKLVSSIFSFGLVIAFANLMPAETYGTYSYVMAAISIIALTSLPGVDSSLVPAVARGFDGSLFTAQKVRFWWSSIGMLLLLLTSGYYWYQGNIVLGTSFLVGGLLFPFYIAFNQYGLYLSGKKLFREFALQTVEVKSLFAASLVATLFFTDNVAILIAINLGVIALTGIFFTTKTIYKYKDALNTPPEKDLISYGKHLTVMNAFETTSKYLDKILLWHFFGPVQVAIWAFANTPIQILQGMISKTVGTVAVPKFAQNNFNQTKSGLPGKVIKLFLVLFPVVLLYILAAPHLFQNFLPQYLESVIYTQVLATLLLLIPFNFLTYFLQANTKKRDLYIIKIIFGSTSTIALLLFIPTFGLWGAAIAHITANTARSVAAYILFSRA